MTLQRRSLLNPNLATRHETIHVYRGTETKTGKGGGGVPKGISATLSITWNHSLWVI